MDAIRFAEKLIGAGICAREEFVPCSASEVSGLEKKLGQPLPAEYKKFLLLGGRGMGDYMADWSAFYPEIVDLTERIRDVFSYDLPENAFVFVDYIGDAFVFFNLNDGDDPKVYGCSDSSDGVKQFYESIWEFFGEMIQNFC